jgi:uncharacterized membrane protein YbaN (DUF454 family)
MRGIGRELLDVVFDCPVTLGTLGVVPVALPVHPGLVGGAVAICLATSGDQLAGDRVA